MLAVNEYLTFLTLRFCLKMQLRSTPNFGKRHGVSVKLCPSRGWEEGVHVPMIT